jgi:Mnd1 HTH domain
VSTKAAFITLLICCRYTTKDVNQELVNDGLVDTDKIGASNFFWSFPTQVLMKRTTNVQFLKEKIAVSATACETLHEYLMSKHATCQACTAKTTASRQCNQRCMHCNATLKLMVLSHACSLLRMTGCRGLPSRCQTQGMRQQNLDNYAFVHTFWH